MVRSRDLLLALPALSIAAPQFTPAEASQECNNLNSATTWNNMKTDNYFAELAPTLTNGVYDGVVNAIPSLRSVPCDQLTDACSFDANNCQFNPPDFFILTAMSNFNSLMKVTVNSFQSASTVVSDLATNIPYTFNPDKYKPNAMGNVLNQAAAAFGIASAVAGLVPEMDMTNAFLGFAGAFIGFIKPPSNPPDAGADVGTLETQLAGILNSTETQINDYYHTVMAQPPPSDWVTNPQHLPSLFRNGAFMGTPKFNTDNQFVAFQSAFAAPLINKVWSEANIIVVKGSTKTFDFNPCDPSRLQTMSPHKYCVPGTDTMYLLLKQPTDIYNPPISVRDPMKFAVDGIDALGTYSLSIQNVVLSSWNSQTGGGYSAPPPDLSAPVNAIMQNPQVGKEDLVNFNLPVCDMDMATDNNNKGYNDFCGIKGQSQSDAVSTSQTLGESLNEAGP